MSISDLQKLPVTKPDNLNQICALLNKKVIEGANNCMKEKSEEVDLKTCSKKDSYVFTDESNNSKIFVPFLKRFLVNPILLVIILELDILHNYGKIPKISSLWNKPLVIES